MTTREHHLELAVLDLFIEKEPIEFLRLLELSAARPSITRWPIW